jgi:glutamine amidotransferase
MLVIVDYKMGNHHSVKKKLDGLKVESIISSDPETILNATKLILPGVGHFGKAMENLRSMNLIAALNEAVLIKKTPILGICLGMQLMAKSSEEGISTDARCTSSTDARCTSENKPRTSSEVEMGFGWFDADVVKFKLNDTLRFKVPHTGWNTISIEKESHLMKNIPVDSEFYFVHSYYMKANDSADVLNYTEYGTPFASAISKGNIYGFQYHPEKSHDVGLLLLKNFLELS